MQDARLRALLRSLPVFADVTGDPVELDRLAASPLEELRSQLLTAIEIGEAEPHAMTLSTVSSAGIPNSRVLLCKDVDADALYFAASRTSRKGQELASTGRAAANFYWRRSGRQFRVSGQVFAQPDDVAAADFAARDRTSQIAALLGGAEEPTTTEEVQELARDLSRELPEIIPAPPDWVVYALVPNDAELWQARKDRLHTRVYYEKSSGGWRRELRWP